MKLQKKYNPTKEGIKEFKKDFYNIKKKEIESKIKDLDEQKLKLEKKLETIKLVKKAILEKSDLKRDNLRARSKKIINPDGNCALCNSSIIKEIEGLPCVICRNKVVSNHFFIVKSVELRAQHCLEYREVEAKRIGYTRYFLKYIFTPLVHIFFFDIGFKLKRITRIKKKVKEVMNRRKRKYKVKYGYKKIAPCGHHIDKFVYLGKTIPTENQRKVVRIFKCPCGKIYAETATMLVVIPEDGFEEMVQDKKVKLVT